VSWPSTAAAEHCHDARSVLVLAQDFVLLLPSKTVTYQSGHYVMEDDEPHWASSLEEGLQSQSLLASGQGSACAYGAGPPQCVSVCACACVSVFVSLCQCIPVCYVCVSVLCLCVLVCCVSVLRQCVVSVCCVSVRQCVVLGVC